MERPVGALPLISFAEPTTSHALFDTLNQAGFSIRPLNTDEWLASMPGEIGSVILFLIDEKFLDEKANAALCKASGMRSLAIINGAGDAFDSKLICRCTDFITWPCHPKELQLRIERAHTGYRRIPKPIEENDLLRDLELNGLVGKSAPFMEVVRLVERIAECSATALIRGETGTGKELVARAIHRLGARRNRPFVPINCGAIPDSLFENELFGHERGAFTDARTTQRGLIEQAQGGTLFLDEVDTLSHKAQVALLRFLQDQEFKPLGGTVPQKGDVRIIAAGNADLHDLVMDGHFRQDLLFRLNIMQLNLPSLRQRADDIELLANHFIRRYSEKYGVPAKALDPAALAWMRTHYWPGNIRELENTLHRGLLLSAPSIIHLADIVDRQPGEHTLQPEHKKTNFSQLKREVIEEFERNYLRSLLRATKGNVSLAAKLIGKERRALGKLLKKHAIDRTGYVV